MTPVSPSAGHGKEDVITDTDSLRLPFTLRGISGLIAVSVTRNTDPDAIGYFLLTGSPPADAARGFPFAAPRSATRRTGMRPRSAGRRWSAQPTATRVGSRWIPLRFTGRSGFAWDFTINHQDITLARPAALGPEAWDSHLDLLRASYPDWIFDSGYSAA